MRSASENHQQCALFTYPFTGYLFPHPSSLIARLQVTQPESPSARVLELREKAERTALLDAAATRVLEEAGSRLEEAGVGIGSGQRRTVSSLTFLKCRPDPSKCFPLSSTGTGPGGCRCGGHPGTGGRGGWAGADTLWWVLSHKVQAPFAQLAMAPL